MTIRFICLANSIKVGGRCVAGVEVDQNNCPIVNKSRPKWIRPISANNHGEIPTNVAEKINILDIVEIEIINLLPQQFQSENVIFDYDSIKVIGQFDANDLDEICEDVDKIFLNKGKAIHQDDIGKLDHSLMLLLVKDFEITQEGSKLRLKFNYNDINYDLPITDPLIKDLDALKKCNLIYLTLSVGVEHNGWYSKLVAGIIK